METLANDEEQRVRLVRAARVAVRFFARTQRKEEAFYLHFQLLPAGHLQALQAWWQEADEWKIFRRIGRFRGVGRWAPAAPAGPPVRAARRVSAALVHLVAPRAWTRCPSRALCQPARGLSGGCRTRTPASAGRTCRMRDCTRSPRPSETE